MLMRLHANATTTPKVRAYIQASGRSAVELRIRLRLSLDDILEVIEMRTEDYFELPHLT